MIFFISDLHLSPRSPGATHLFLNFLVDRARQAEALYILGDLFETWIGDDDASDAFNADIVAGLRAATTAGLQINLLHGNRDFLLGAEFSAATGCRLINDPHIVSTAEWQFVLSHGDALCLDDVDYMAFRQQVRNPAWISDFLTKPLSERRVMAAHMRQMSEQVQRSRSNYLTDLQPAATEDFLREHGYATFIHGHTHQPAKHDHIVDGIHVERWVLADWQEERGEVLVWDGETLQREILS